MKAPRDYGAWAAYLEDRASWTFGYTPEPRMQDCARWIAGGLVALTVRNPLSEFNGRWTSEIGAARVIRRHGGMISAVGSVLNEVLPTFAQRGDVALTESGALTFVLGDLLVGLDEARGYVYLPRASAVQFWSAG